MSLPGTMQLNLNSDDLSSFITDVVHRANVLDTSKDEFIDSLPLGCVSLHITDGPKVIDVRSREPNQSADHRQQNIARDRRAREDLGKECAHQWLEQFMG